MSAQPNILAFPPSSQPQELVEKYRPRFLSEFCGLSKPKEILSRLAERPFASNWLLCGGSWHRENHLSSRPGCHESRRSPAHRKQ